MLLLLIRKRNPSSLFSSFVYKTSSFYCPLLAFPFTSTSDDQNPPPKSSLINDYLIHSCGLSPQKAANASKYLANVSSLLKPESVRHFLKHQGFTDADIRSIVTGYPRIFNVDVDQTLESNLRTLRQLGFADCDLHQLIVRNPQSLLLQLAVQRIEFWRDFFAGNTKKLLAAFTHNRGLINLDIDKNVLPKFALLKDYGVPESHMEMAVVGGTKGFFARSCGSMEVLLKRAEDLGFLRGSAMFVVAATVLHSISRDTFKSKMELFKSFGWTHEQFVAAINKAPCIVCLSKENIRQKVDFLVGHANCTPSYIASHPVLLGFNLQKRLIPRCQLLQVLNSSELIPRKHGVYTFVSYPENRLEKLINKYKVVAPELHEMCLALWKGQL